MCLVSFLVPYHGACRIQQTRDIEGRDKNTVDHTHDVIHSSLEEYCMLPRSAQQHDCYPKVLYTYKHSFQLIHSSETQKSSCLIDNKLQCDVPHLISSRKLNNDSILYNFIVNILSKTSYYGDIDNSDSFQDSRSDRILSVELQNSFC